MCYDYLLHGSPCLLVHLHEENLFIHTTSNHGQIGQCLFVTQKVTMDQIGQIFPFVLKKTKHIYMQILKTLFDIALENVATKTISLNCEKYCKYF